MDVPNLEALWNKNLDLETETSEIGKGYTRHLSDYSFHDSSQQKNKVFLSQSLFDDHLERKLCDDQEDLLHRSCIFRDESSPSSHANDSSQRYRSGRGSVSQLRPIDCHEPDEKLSDALLLPQ